MTLRITRAAIDDITAHAIADYPKEACGIVAGQHGIGARVLRMRNVDESPISYTMDPQEQLQVMKRLRAEGLEMLAIYHSHTATAAYPSPTDVRLATYTDVAYLLVSLTDRTRPDVNSYRIADSVVTIEELQIV